MVCLWTEKVTSQGILTLLASKKDLSGECICNVSWERTVINVINLLVAELQFLLIYIILFLTQKLT